ncbi:MAG: zinc ribbon domain-containing protein [Chloroflexota bacterium]
MRYTLLWSRWLMVFLLVLGLACEQVQAQSAAVRLQRVLIEIWPEFDRADTLVIYRVELAPDTPLPTELAFRLPGYIGAMHAVAAEQNGSLVDVNPGSIQLAQAGDNKQLTFPTTSLKVQFEYYDPVILTRQGQARQLKLELAAPYDVKTAVLQVQEPVQTIDFSMTPAPDNTFTSLDGLTYNNKELTNVTAGDSLALTATYQRQTDELSVNVMDSNAAGLSDNISNPAPDSASNSISLTNLPIGYILIGAGIILLLGTGGYWWWTNARAKMMGDSPQVRRRPGRRHKPARPTSTAVTGPPPATSGYCYHCGAALRAGARFCHVCGAERRTN